MDDMCEVCLSDICPHGNCLCTEQYEDGNCTCVWEIGGELLEVGTEN